MALRRERMALLNFDIGADIGCRTFATEGFEPPELSPIARVRIVIALPARRYDSCTRTDTEAFMRAARLIMAVLCAALLQIPVKAQAREPVDLLLVLAADVSRSVTTPKFQLQREGMAAAITDRAVLDAIAAGPHRRIAVCLVEWAGDGQQAVVIDWKVIDGEEAARSFAGHLVETPRAYTGRTSISGGIDFSVVHLENAPYTSKRRVIDVSGDGNNNGVRAVTESRDEAVAKGIVINGLVILTPDGESLRPAHTNPPGGLEKYFQDNVIGGPGAFTIVADGHKSFGKAIKSKLVAEIAGLPPPQHAAR